MVAIQTIIIELVIAKPSLLPTRTLDSGVNWCAADARPVVAKRSEIDVKNLPISL